jgi:hypothetical protein
LYDVNFKIKMYDSSIVVMANPYAPTAQILTYSEVVDVDMDATNPVNFADVEDYGHRVVVHMFRDALNNFLGWKRDQGTPRPVATIATQEVEDYFRSQLQDALSRGFLDLDGVTGGLHFGSANFDTNPDTRKRSDATSTFRSANDIPMCFVLYKLYGSSAAATLGKVYNLGDAHGMLSNESVATAIVNSFKNVALSSPAGGQNLSPNPGVPAPAVDTMFRDLLAADPYRFFDASGVPVTGIFETNADVNATGTWNLAVDDTIEIKLKLIFKSSVTRRGVAGREHNLTTTATEDDAGAQENQQTIIRPDDFFYIRLQLKAKDVDATITL